MTNWTVVGPMSIPKVLFWYKWSLVHNEHLHEKAISQLKATEETLAADFDPWYETFVAGEELDPPKEVALEDLKKWYRSRCEAGYWSFEGTVYWAEGRRP